MTVDYLKLSGNADKVTNEGSIGVTVDLGGSNGAADIFDGSANSANDVLDARAVNDLAFESAADGYIKVTSGN